ncbi:MAG: ABC transporter substrate-binding protein [Candidatus Hermodarchaeota archaeon]
MRKEKLLSIGGVSVVLMVICFSTVVAAPLKLVTDKWSSDFRPHGGYVDEILFMPNDYEFNAAALMNGEIDTWDERIPSLYILGLIKNPEIEVKIGLSTGYRVIVFNCERFPTNITAYRRAMAFALDKNMTNTEAIGGSGEPLDSYIPLVVPEWGVEKNLTSHFYDADVVAGNASLEAAGFIDLDNDGWREFDKNHNGEWDIGYDLDDNEIAIELIGASFYPALITLHYAKDALEKMGLKATIIMMPLNESIREMKQGNHWAVCLTLYTSLISPASDLYYLFRTGTSDNLLFCRYSNTTIDNILDKMINSVTFSEAKNYALEANKLLTYEQPIVVCYNDAYIDAYRTNIFEGYTLFNGKGYIGDTYTKIRLKEEHGGPYGGTYRIGWSGDIPSVGAPFNILNLWYVDALNYFRLIYETLWQIDPITWDPIPGLAYNWTIEQTTLDDTTEVQNGQKFTFYLYENATWHDDQPVTSEDVKYSFETLRPHCIPESPYTNEEMKNIYRIDTPDQHTVEIYVNKSGYFEWALTTSFLVLPKHIWEPHSANFTAWEPNPLSPVDFTGSGPYKFNEFISNEHLSLIRYDDWRWDIREVTSDSISGFEVITAFSTLIIAIIYFKQRKKNNPA